MPKPLQSVLLVDDSDVEHTIMGYLLEDYGQPVKLLSAFDGQEALDLLDTLDTPPDIIFLDINMPRMDGHEFLEAYNNLREPDDAPIVVMLTSSDQDRDKDRCKAYGFVKNYVLKPIELDDLKTAVDQLP